MNTADDTYSYTRQFTLSAGHGDARGKMPLTLLVDNIIEVATMHADLLGLGYETLIKSNIGWVLSRLSVEMTAYPAINSTYAIRTWIESTNRFFSLRNFAIISAGGTVMGYVRTVWVAIDFSTRRMASLSPLGFDKFVRGDLPCPIAPTPALEPSENVLLQSPYTFRYCDIDANRHVNTVRYVEALLNMYSIDWHWRHTPARFDIIFHKECKWGQTVAVTVYDNGTSHICAIADSDNGTNAITAQFLWTDDDQ